MKRLLCVLTVFAVIFGSCATQPGGDTGDTGNFGSQEEIDAAFENIYKNYRNALIMDGAENYTVARGDTLTKITGAKYGNGNIYYFPIIMLASDEVNISDPDLILPNMKLKIPVLQKNLDNPISRLQIKAYLGDIAGVYDKKGSQDTAGKLRDLAATL
ncbi:hypothetical protein FACS1894161_0290 [Spirochaetia bacterium]|nr:hypothetical protein FACS1894161_0290 [Spirochaetia bacterium]